MDNLEQQFQDIQDANGDVTSADMIALLTGGDTVKGDTPNGESGKPDASAAEVEGLVPPVLDGTAPADDKTKPAATTEVEDAANSVIIAKDGKHTISYDKLVTAREEARAAREETASLRAELEAARKAPAAPAPAPSAAPAPAVDDPTADAEALFGDYTAQQMKGAVEQIVARALAARDAQVKADVGEIVKPLQDDANTRAIKEHLTTIYTAHPDADSLVESTEFESWKAAQPSFMRPVIDQTMAKGTTAQIVELLDTYRAAHPLAAAAAPAPAVPAAAKTATQRAQEVLNGVINKAPTTLSEIPAGSQAHHDEAEALLEMDSQGLMDKIYGSGKSPAEIERLMSRIL